MAVEGGDWISSEGTKMEGWGLRVQYCKVGLGARSLKFNGFECCGCDGSGFQTAG